MSDPLPREAGAMPAVDRGWRVTVSIGIVVASLISGLFLISHDSASSRSNQPHVLPTVAIGPDEACGHFARFWLDEAPLGLDYDVIEGLTNCRQAADGSWIVPADAGDQRLPAAMLMTAAERGATGSLRRRLLQEIALLEISFSPSIARDLSGIYTADNAPIVGHVSDRVGAVRQRSRYARLVNAFLLDPNHETLADYVGWAMGRRIAAYERLLTSCTASEDVALLRTACRGIEETLNVRYPPWPWDLKSSVLLEEYLGFLARSGQIDAGVQQESVTAKYAGDSR